MAITAIDEIRDVDGITWDDWADEMFEFNYCEECGKDKDEHRPVLLMGHWFAQCLNADDGSETCPACGYGLEDDGSCPSVDCN